MQAAWQWCEGCCSLVQVWTITAVRHFQKPTERPTERQVYVQDEWVPVVKLSTSRHKVRIQSLWHEQTGITKKLWQMQKSVQTTSIIAQLRKVLRNSVYGAFDNTPALTGVSGDHLHFPALKTSPVVNQQTGTQQVPSQRHAHGHNSLGDLTVP